ncbi:MAG: hypothetical protein LBV52_03660 [Spirochaetaceae bacterium]|jgi:hypothetical protein|nr:hypothetical protein [Spirochaetaceae bacterium]
METRIKDDSKISEKDLVFYYSREERLKKAPQCVRDLYEAQPVKRFAFFRSLVDTRTKAFMFISIIAICLVVLAMTYLVPQKTGKELLGNEITASAIRYDGATFVVIKKTIKKIGAYTGIVDVNIASIANGKNQYDSEIFWTDAAEEEARYRLPFNANEISIQMQAKDKTVNLNIKSD